MIRRLTSRRTVVKGALALAAAGVAGRTSAFAAADPFAPELIDAAKREGRVVYYTANFAEVERQVIAAFNKRFPFVQIEMVRAPGGQLITRVKTEAAAGKLAADIVDHSDRGLMLDIEDHFADYAPPNAGDYLPDVLVSPKYWPRATIGWSIAYNSELVKDPPKSWMDLTKPEYGNGQIGQVIGPSGGTTWTRIMFERQVLGEDYWQKQAATKPVLFPSGAPLEIFFPPEGVPINPYASGIPKTAANPNAAKLFLNWCLSAEGQTFMIKELGHLTSLKQPPAYPEGYDPKVVKVWVPNFEQYRKLHATWMEEWDKTYGYRQ